MITQALIIKKKMNVEILVHRYPDFIRMKKEECWAGETGMKPSPELFITSRHLHQDISSCCLGPSARVIECHFYLRELLKVIVSAIQSCPKKLKWVKQSLELQCLAAIKSTQAWWVVVPQLGPGHPAAYSGHYRFDSDPVTFLSRVVHPSSCLSCHSSLSNLIKKEGSVKENIKNSYLMQAVPASGSVVQEPNEI